MSGDLQNPLTQEQDQPQLVPHEYQQPPQYQQQQYQNQQYPNQQQYPPHYDNSEYQQHQQRANIESEYRQSGNQPVDDLQYPSHNEGISQIQNIDQLIRIIPCALMGLSVIIIGSIFMAKCTLTQPSVYVSSGAILLIMPLVVYQYDINSKFMNFISSIISFYYMVILAVFVDQQQGTVLDDQQFYTQYCLKEGDTEAFSGISYGLVNLLGLCMCLLHTINMAYYFCQVWILSKHHIKDKIEHYTYELI